MIDATEAAILLATKAHQGQTDRQGLPYILHPLRVMLAGNTEEERIVGVLHDTLEDTQLTERDLIMLDYPQVITDALVLLMHFEGEEYQAYIERLAPNPLARAVKLLDLKDNMARKDSLGAPARARLMARYTIALEYLDNYDLTETE